jgi:hypothetical protein
MKGKMPTVESCEAFECAFNSENKCHALAINVGGPDDDCPACDTFLNSKKRGGLIQAIGSVGACKVEECKFNSLFECSAKGIAMHQHSGHADCSTFATT